MTPTGIVTTLYSFCSEAPCTEGSGPASLILGPDGNFYGTTFAGGAFEEGGTIFKIIPAGQLTTLFAFTAGGFSPRSLLFANGNLYGTSRGGGQWGSICVININDGDTGCGTFFELTP